VTAPVRGYRQIYSGALIEPPIEDHLPRLVLVDEPDPGCRPPWDRCLALCLLATTGRRQPFPITRHLFSSYERATFDGRQVALADHLDRQSTIGRCSDSEIVARAKTADVA
jgi:hypothetical protein